MDGQVVISRTARACLLAVMVASAAGFASGASAQDGAALAPFAECDAPRCLGVSANPELLQAAAEAGEVSIAAFADAVTFAYSGEEPLDVRLIAARYDRGRLVRYGVSELTEIDPAGGEIAIGGAREAILKAFTPVTERGGAVALVGGNANSLPVSAQAFVGSVPFTNLFGPPESALLSEDTLGEDATATALDGSVGVIAVTPEDGALRAPEESQAFGLVVWLAFGD